MLNKLLILGIINGSDDYLNYLINLECINKYASDKNINYILINNTDNEYNHNFIRIINKNIDLLKEILYSNINNYLYFCNPNCYLNLSTILEYINLLKFNNIILFDKLQLIFTKRITNLECIFLNKLFIYNIINLNLKPFLCKINLILSNDFNESIFFNIEKYLYHLVLKENYTYIKISNKLILFNYYTTNKLLDKKIIFPYKVINKVVVQNIGNWGFANQMFQYALMYVVSKIKGCNICFKNNNLSNLKIIEFEKIKNTLILNSFNNYDYIKENHFHYDPTILELVKNSKKNICLSGFFQSYQYFEKYKNDILNLYSLSNDQETKIKTIFDNNTKNFNNITSIHVRRGDYLNHKDYHDTLPLSYYQKSIKKIESSFYYIFSDDVKWCNKNLIPILDKPYIISTESAFVDMFLMSFCNNNIIANSSFSWWGAYLNKHENKKIVCPSKWFGFKGPQKHDLFSSEWIICDI